MHGCAPFPVADPRPATILRGHLAGCGGGIGRRARWLLFATSMPAWPWFTGQALAQASPTSSSPPVASAVQPEPVEVTPAAAQDAPPPRRLNPTGRMVELVVPLRDRVPLGQVGIRITPDDQVLVSAGDVAAALSRVITAETIEGIRAIPATDGFVPLSALQATGIVIAYDPAQLELALDIAATLRRPRSISVGFQRMDQPVEQDRSDRFSFYLAYRASLDYVHVGDRTGLRAPRVDVDFNGRLAGLVAFENELTYDGDAENEFVRRASRVIYDRPEQLLRFTAGDQIPVQTSFQDAVDVLGIGAARLLGTFRSDRVVTATSSRTITLREAATVNVVVNGVPVRSLRLDSGVYDLADLPLTTGANNVELVIEDDAGGRRVVSFDFFEDFQLLAPGVDEFDLQAGVRSRFENLRRRYFTEEPIFTGFYRRGLTSQLTVGANAQVTRRIQQVGFEGTIGTSIGLFSLETSFSNIDGFGFGHAQRLQYRYSTPLQQLRGARRFDVQIEHRSRNFGGVETIVPLNLASWRLTARYSQPVTRYLSAGLGIDYTAGRDGFRDQYGARGTVTWGITPFTVFTASAGYDNRDKLVFGFSLIHRFGRSSTATAQYESRDNQATFTYNRAPLQTLDAVAVSAQVTRTSDEVAVNATGTYRSNRGDFELAHRASYGLDEDDIVDQVSSVRTRGTIAFSGGRVAWGRYLSDSFAIVSAHPSLGDAPVSAPIILGDRLSGRTVARTGTFGPALVPLSSYTRQTIPFEVPDAPAGYDLGAGNFAVYPWLNSGYHFTVGSEYNVTILGTLLDDTGRPMALLAGTARKIDDPNSPVVEVFTNRIGRFGASGLGPGRWRMRFADGLFYDIEITRSQGSFANFGTIRPTGRQE